MREIHLKNSLIGIFAVAKITKIHILIQIELVLEFLGKISTLCHSVQT